MTKLKKLKFWKSIGLIIIALFTVLIGSVYLVLSYWEPIASKTIKQSFYHSTNKLYRIEFDDITFNIFLGDFGLKNIKLIPDLNVYKELKLKKEQPAYLFTLSIEKAKLHGIDLYNLYQYKELHIDEIAVNNPNVKVINDLSYKKSGSDTSIFRNPYDLLKSQLHNLNVGQINLKNINFEFVADSLGKVKIKKIFLSYFKVRNLIIDSLSQFDTTRPFYSDDIKVSIKNFTHTFKDSVNSLNFEEAVASTATSSIQVYNFKIIPKLNEATYADTQGFRKTRIELYIKEANLTHIDFKKLFFEQKLYGKAIDINKIDSKILQNKIHPIDKTKKVKFPTELVYDIKIPFHFDIVNIRNAEVNYSEIERKSAFKWDINFSNIYGKIENLSNDSTYLRKNQFANISLDAIFNNTAKSHFDLTLDYTHILKPFYVKGIFTNYNLKGLNPIISKVAYLEVSNCNLRTLRFVMNGDKDFMSCNVSMLYNNLKVKVLHFNKEENKLEKHGLFTILANHMVLASDNPRKNGKLIKSKFHLKREGIQSFFGFIWRGILRGMKESVGLNDQMERELKFQQSRYNEFKNFAKEFKDNRARRKQERFNLKKTTKVADSSIYKTKYN